MSIASAITSLQSRVADAYTSVGNKGGTLPATQDTLHLPAAIASIPAGSSTKWGMSIEGVCYTDNNGVAKLFGGVSGALTFTGVTDISAYGMTYSFYKNNGITTVSFPSLTGISGSWGGHGLEYAFYQSSVTSVSFPELLTVGDSGFGNNGSHFANAFQNCTSLTTASFPKLTGIYGTGAFTSAFRGCTSLTSVSFPELTGASTSSFASAFVGCTLLTSVSFTKLATIDGTSTFSGAFGAGTSTSPASGVTTLAFPALTAIISNAAAAGAIFRYNKTLTRIDFPVLSSMKKTANATTDNLTYIFNDCTNLTELHFGSANQSVIEASDGYATKWGAPNANCTIYFDL